MQIGRVIEDGKWKTGVLAPSPLVQVDGDDAPDIASVLDRIQEQLDELRAAVEASAPADHTHELAEIDGAAEVKQQLADVAARVSACEDAIANVPTNDTLNAALAGKAYADHRHAPDDVDYDPRYATLTDGLLDRAVIPHLVGADLPAHGHRAVEISGLGSAATHDAHTIEDLARRVAALETGK